MVRFSVRLSPNPLVIDAAAREAILRARVLRCSRRGATLDGNSDACTACRLPIDRVFAADGLLFADIQCLRVIRRSAIAGVAGSVAIFAGQVLGWADPFSPAGMMLLIPGYTASFLTLVYLTIGLALFGRWWSMRLIVAVLLVGIAFRVATLVLPTTGAIAVEFADLLALNAAPSLLLCVAMAIVGRLLRSTWVIAGFLGAGLLVAIQFIGALAATRALAFGDVWIHRYILDECVMRLVLAASFAAALVPVARLTKVRRQIDQIVDAPSVPT